MVGELFFNVGMQAGMRTRMVLTRRYSHKPGNLEWNLSTSTVMVSGYKTAIQKRRVH